MPTDELHDALHGWYPPPDLLTLSKMQVIPSALCCRTRNNVTCFTSCRERLTLIGPGLRKVSDFSRTYGRCSERAIGRLARAWCPTSKCISRRACILGEIMPHRRYGTDSETTAHQTTASCSNAAFWHSQQSLVAAPSTSQDSLAARRVNDGRLADVDMHAMSRVFASDGVAIS